MKFLMLANAQVKNYRYKREKMMGKLFSGLPIIETDRIRLRSFRIEDAEEYYNYHNLCDISDGYDWRPETISEAEDDIGAAINDYKEMESVRWAIAERSSDRIIGDCGIITDGYKGEYNYMLSKLYRGKGIMKESLNALTAVCFMKTELQRIQALTFTDNIKSNNLLRSLGFIKEGTLRKYGYNSLTGNLMDLNMWALLKEDYKGYTEFRIVRDR